MPKSRIPSVEIKIGGETRHLIYGHHALGELEEQAALLTDSSKIKSVILALWAGLLTETLDYRGRETPKTLSKFQIAALLDALEPEEIEALCGKIMEAQTLAKPPENPPPASEIPPA